MLRRMGLVLTVTALSAALTSVAGASVRHSDQVSPSKPARFACYLAQFGPFRPRPPQTLVDAFTRTRVSVIAPDSVCAPAPGAQTHYLTCYRAKARTGFGTRPTPKGDDEFGRFRVKVSALQTLCVPSARVDDGGLRIVATENLFTCYSTTGRSLPSLRVQVEDEFGRSDDALTGLVSLCAPAARSGSRPYDSRRFLTCYTDRSETTGTTVVLRNEFGYLKASLGPRARLCVSAAAK